MFFIYSLIYFFVMLALLPFEYRKRPKPVRSVWLKEKFGFVNPGLLSPGSGLIWFHAVSMGEVISAVPFIKKIKAQHGAINIILSTVTDTGQQIARERLSGMADIVYLPFDLVSVIRRFLGQTRPDIFVAIETELWPNIFRTLNKFGIPVLVMNGRLSENSFNGYKKIRPFIRRVVRSADMFCMQEPVYAERIVDLGADRDRVKITGNFKFDTKPPGPAPEWTKALKGHVIVAGSTHETEEELIIESYLRLRPEFPDLSLVLAPRHPERFSAVEVLIRKKGMECIKRSEFKPSAFRTLHSAVVLLDVVGELASVYGACDIAIIGGSFIRHGGQNSLEPAFWGKPIVCGPHMENFPFMKEFYNEGGAVLTDAGSLYDNLKDLVQLPEKRKVLGDKARNLYNEKTGAINRSLGILENYIGRVHI